MVGEEVYLKARVLRLPYCWRDLRQGGADFAAVSYDTVSSHCHGQDDIVDRACGG